MTTSLPHTHVRLRDLSELVAGIPYVLGFPPTDSLVLFTFRRCPILTLSTTIRVDLPKHVHVPLVVTELSAAAARNEAVAAIAVVVGEDAPEHRELIQHLRITMADNDILLTHASWVRKVVHGEQWQCYDDPLCTGAVPDPQTSALAAAIAVAGDTTYPDREAMAAHLAPDPEEALARRKKLLDAYRTGQPRTYGEQELQADLRTLGHALDMALSSYDPPSLNDHQLARLAMAMSQAAIRDECLAITLTDEPEPTERLWTVLVRSLPAPERAEPAVLLAMSAYLRGAGVLAALALEIALDANPQHRTAILLDYALQMGMPPARLKTMLRTCTVTNEEEQNPPPPPNDDPPWETTPEPPNPTTTPEPATTRSPATTPDPHSPEHSHSPELPQAPEHPQVPEHRQAPRHRQSPENRAAHPIQNRTHIPTTQETTNTAPGNAPNLTSPQPAAPPPTEPIPSTPATTSVTPATPEHHLQLTNTAPNPPATEDPPEQSTTSVGTSPPTNTPTDAVSTPEPSREEQATESPDDMDQAHDSPPTKDDQRTTAPETSAELTMVGGSAPPSRPAVPLPDDDSLDGPWSVARRSACGVSVDDVGLALEVELAVAAADRFPTPDPADGSPAAANVVARAHSMPSPESPLDSSAATLASTDVLAAESPIAPGALSQRAATALGISITHTTVPTALTAFLPPQNTEPPPNTESLQGPEPPLTDPGSTEQRLSDQPPTDRSEPG